MVFTKRLREGIRRGRIRSTVRIWKHLHVKVGGRYPMDQGHVVVDAIESLRMKDITGALARESGFDSVDDLLQTAKHGTGNNVYLIRFHYLADGAWDTQEQSNGTATQQPTLLDRIDRASVPRRTGVRAHKAGKPSRAR
jgi:hypothetical protein